MKIRYLILLFLPITACGQIDNLQASMDSVWYQDFLYSAEQFSIAKAYTSTCKQSKDDELLSTELKINIKVLDSIYKDEINEFLIWYRNDSDVKRRGVYKYLATCNRYQYFYFYPKIYNILFNPIRLDINKKIDKKRQLFATQVYNEIRQIIKEEGLELKLEKRFEGYIKSSLEIDTQLFKGSIEPAERIKYEFVDFLILLSR